MPAVSKIIPSRGKEYWDSLDPGNLRQVLEAVMTEYGRSEPDHLHYSAGEASDRPPTVCGGIRVSFPCFRDCQIFLLRGAFVIEGQGRVDDTGCSYVVKDEEWIEFCGSETVIVVIEEGHQRGVCRQNTQAWRERILHGKEKSKSSTDCVLM